MYVYAPNFYTTFHQVSFELMGTVLLVTRLLDAVQDPLIGMVSDRLRGHRFTIINSGLVLLTVSFVALYNPIDRINPLLWFSVCIVGAALGFSTVSINYNALGSLWSRQPFAKTAIVAAREGSGLVGLLLATLAPALLQLKFEGALAYQIYAGLFIIVAGGSLFLFNASEKRRIVLSETSDVVPSGGRLDWRLLFRKPFGSLFAVYGLSSLASAIPGVLVVFYIRDLLRAENMTGLFLGIYFLSGVLGMPAWKRLAERFGKQHAWIGAMIMAMLCFSGAFWIRQGDVVAYGAVCLFSGLALGAELVLPLSIASDLIDATRLQTRSASVFAILLFMSKLALALASFVAFRLLFLEGYVPDTMATPHVILALSFVYAGVPSGLKLLAALLALYLRPSLIPDEQIEKI